MASRRSRQMVAAMVLAALGAPVGLEAQLCGIASGGPFIDFIPGPDTAGGVTQPCSPYRCNQPTLAAPRYSIVGTCNPTSSSCTARADVLATWPGNQLNPTGAGPVAFLNWQFSSGAPAGACPGPGSLLLWGSGDARRCRATSTANSRRPRAVGSCARWKAWSTFSTIRAVGRKPSIDTGTRRPAHIRPVFSPA